MRPSQKLIKRTIDIAGASFALTCFGPFFVLIALAIRLDSKGPVWFKQKRLARDAKPFMVRSVLGWSGPNFAFRSLKVSSKTGRARSSFPSAL